MSEDHGKALGPDLLRMINGMRSAEDPRVKTILPCAYLELRLTTLLEQKMPALTDRDLWERFFGDRGFVTEIGKKILVARAIGALGAKLAKRIATIAKIRNQFAHNLHVTDFEHPKVAGLVDSLASTKTPDPQVMTENGWEPLLKNDKEGLFIREAIAACGALTSLLTEGLGFEHTDEAIPQGTPGVTRSISFGGALMDLSNPRQEDQ